MRVWLELVEQTTATPVDLVSLADLKLELGITGADEDERLEASITRISRMIAEECNRILGLSRGIESFTFDPGEMTKPGQKLSLSLYPVTAIESMTIDGVAVEPYGLDRERGLIWIDGMSWSGTVVVEYEGGYELPDAAPAKLQAATIEAVRERRLTVSQDTTVQSTGHGETRVSYFNPRSSSGTLPQGVLDLVSGFKRSSFA